MRRALFLVLVGLFPFRAVFADGMIHVRRLDAWELHRENQQAAVIGYRDGYEKMLITVGLDEKMRGTKAVWIFPIPARPEKATIDVIKAFPHFGWGRDVDSAYRDAVVGTATFMAGYSTFPASLPFLSFYLMRWMPLAPPPGVGPRAAVPDGLTIHERVVKMGLTTELITTETQEALARYLADKGLDLPAHSASILTWYVGRKYSLVVSYISDFSQFKIERQDRKEDRLSQSRPFPPEPRSENGVPIGLLIGFPTDKIFFPLKPTSVYGGQVIPITLYIQGYVTPELYPEIKGRAKTLYYVDEGYQKEGFESVFVGWKLVSTLKYTMMELLAPSSSLVDDLWLRDGAPATVGIKAFLRETLPLWGIALYAVFSILASVWAGRLSFKRQAVSTRRLAGHGLWNFGTVIGFLISTAGLLTTKPPHEIVQAEVGQAGQARKKWDSRKIAYVLLFYIFFLGLTTASGVLLLALH